MTRVNGCVQSYRSVADEDYVESILVSAPRVSLAAAAAATWTQPATNPPGRGHSESREGGTTPVWTLGVGVGVEEWGRTQRGLNGPSVRQLGLRAVFDTQNH